MKSSSFLQCTLLGGKLSTYEVKEAGGEDIIYSTLIFSISLYKGHGACRDLSTGDRVPLPKVTY